RPQMSTGPFGVGSKIVFVAITPLSFIGLFPFVLVYLELVLQVDELAPLLDLYRGVEGEPDAYLPEDGVELSAAYLLSVGMALEVVCQLVDQDTRLAGVVVVGRFKDLVAPVVEELR